MTSPSIPIWVNMRPKISKQISRLWDTLVFIPLKATSYPIYFWRHCSLRGDCFCGVWDPGILSKCRFPRSRLRDWTSMNANSCMVDFNLLLLENKWTKLSMIIAAALRLLSSFAPCSESLLGFVLGWWWSPPEWGNTNLIVHEEAMLRNLAKVDPAQLHEMSDELWKVHARILISNSPFKWRKSRLAGISSHCGRHQSLGNQATCCPEKRLKKRKCSYRRRYS